VDDHAIDLGTGQHDIVGFVVLEDGVDAFSPFNQVGTVGEDNMGQFLLLDGSGDFLLAEEVPDMPFQLFFLDRNGIEKRMDIAEMLILAKPHFQLLPVLKWLSSGFCQVL